MRPIRAGRITGELAALAFLGILAAGLVYFHILVRSGEVVIMTVEERQRELELLEYQQAKALSCYY